MPILRVGKVTNVYQSTGKVKVLYEDTGNTSMPLSMISTNGECYLPSVGERVVTLHMETGSSKGFVLGTYFGEINKPSGIAVGNKEVVRRIERIEDALGLPHDI